MGTVKIVQRNYSYRRGVANLSNEVATSLILELLPLTNHPTARMHYEASSTDTSSSTRATIMRPSVFPSNHFLQNGGCKVHGTSRTVNPTEMTQVNTFGFWYFEKYIQAYIHRPMLWTSLLCSKYTVISENVECFCKKNLKNVWENIYTT